MLAENLVDLLAQNNIVSSDLVVGLRERIAQSPQPIPAEVFAERLVEHQVLTPSQANTLLLQLRSGQGKSIPSKPLVIPPPVISTVPIPNFCGTPPLATSSSGAVARPFFSEPTGAAILPPVITTPNDAVLPIAHAAWDDTPNAPKRFTKRKIAKDPWDSRLIIFGGAGLFVLFLIGFFLFGSLFRRSADAMFENADKNYQQGAYSQAIVGYTNFVKAFPNHSKATVARIRLALARIRQLVDAQLDWGKALGTAIEELKEIENEPTFFEESRGELSVILPRIASGLVADALEQSSQFHADHAEVALTLIAKYLPPSLQPSEQLAEVRAKIARVRRVLVKLDELGEAEKKLQSLLDKTAWNKSTLDECFTAFDALLADYPELADEPRFKALLRNVMENACRAIETMSDEEIGRVQPVSPEPHTNAVPLVSLFYRNHQSDAPTTSEQVVFACGDGTIYALRASDGLPLWRRANVLSARADWGTAPIFQTVEPTNRLPQPTVLLLDSHSWTLFLLRAATGEPLWSFVVGEPFRISNVVSDEDHATVALTTEAGTLRILSFAENVEIRGFRLPQSTSVAPFIDPVQKIVCQLADRETLYILPTDNPTKNRSIHMAHQRSTIRTAPVRFGTYLLIVVQTGIRQCSLNVLNTEQNFELTDRIPIPGLVDAAPDIDGSFAVLAIDSGATFLFELVDGKLEKIAEGSTGDEKHGIVRFVSLVGKNVWVADDQLMRFEAQLSQRRLWLREAVKRNIVTLQPLRRHGKMLFHAYQLPSFGSIGVQAVSTDNVKVLWATEFSDAIVTEPQVRDGVTTIHTASGKAYDVNVVEVEEPFLGQPTMQLPPGAIDGSLTEVLPIKDGFDVWVPNRTEHNRTVVVYDPTVSEATRFRTLLLPIPSATAPIALDGRLLVPLSDGQIALFDVKTGRPVALPFVTTIADERQPLWTPPIAIPNTKEFLIVNNRPDENDQIVLHRVAIIDENGEKLIEKSQLALDRPIRSPITVAGSVAAMVDERNVFVTVQLDDWTLGTSVNLSAPCVWGPYVIDDGFVFATADLTLRFFDTDGERFTCPAPTPIGKPLVDGDTVSFNSADGKFWNVDRKTGKLGTILETGVPASVGPVRVGNAILCSGQDGSVYRIAP